MDRSFLLQAAVVAASRDLVCVRLMSYENKEEMAFLKAIGAGKSGEAENTVFGFLAPDGKRLLGRATRGPRGTAAELAENMTRIAKDFPAKQDGVSLELPVVANMRLAMNVAACDRQPLVVLRSDDPEMRRKLSNEIAKLAWSPEFIGRFIYVLAEKGQDLDVVNEAPADAAIYVIDPDTFGIKGKVLCHGNAEASPRKLAETLKTGLIRFKRTERNFWQHVKTGQGLGVFWETATPVTDPMELRAREKGKKKF